MMSREGSNSDKDTEKKETDQLTPTQTTTTITNAESTAVESAVSQPIVPVQPSATDPVVAVPTLEPIMTQPPVFKPVIPLSLLQPVAVEPMKPVEPVITQTAAAKPISPVALEPSAQPAQLVAITEPVAAQPIQPVATVEPVVAQPSQPMSAIEPMSALQPAVEVSEPEFFSQSIIVPEPAKSVETESSTEPAKPVEPVASEHAAGESPPTKSAEDAGSEARMSGWLTKEGAIWKTWRRRYFVLDPPNLYYYKKQTDKVPVGNIDLRSSGHVRGVQYKKVKFAFQVQTPSRTYYICGDSADDRDKWVEALNAALAELRPVALKRAVQITDFELLKLVYKVDETERIVEVRYRDEGTLFLMRIIDRKNPVATAWVENYVSETLVMQNIIHPFVANLKHFFTTDDKYFFILDDVKGIQLSVVLQKGGALPVELVRFLGAEICLAIEHFHSCGIVVPVISPENVTLTPEGHACFLSLSPLGSPCRKDYRCPELFRAEAKHVKAYDWWCFGCLLYELLTGKPPFRGESDDEMRHSVLCDPVLLPSAIPADAKNLVAKLLERRADKRLSDSSMIKRQEFFHAIDLEMLYKKQIPPPVDGAALSMVMGNPIVPPKVEGDGNDSQFAGFTFVAQPDEANTASGAVESSGKGQQVPETHPAADETKV